MGIFNEVPTYFYLILPIVFVLGFLDILAYIIYSLPTYVTLLAWIFPVVYGLDICFFAGLTLVLLMIIYGHYLDPSRVRGFVLFIFMFLIGFLWQQMIIPIVSSLGTSMYMSTYSPITYSIFSSIYGLYYFIAMLMLDVLANFVSPHEVAPAKTNMPHSGHTP